MQQRLPGLDSLRGLAALSVLFCHLLDSIRDTPLRESYGLIYLLSDKTVAHVFTNGLDAVLLFFMHSGFVLALPFTNTKVSTVGFTIKRIFRIYPAHIVVMLSLMAAIWFTHPTPLADMGEWFNRKCTILPSMIDIFKQSTLIGLDASIEPKHFNGVVWSLVHELRISFIFPLLALLFLRRHPFLQLLAIAMWPIAATKLHEISFIANRPLLYDFATTFGYIQYFFIGMFLAEHRHGIAEWWQKLTLSSKSGILVIGLLCYAGHSQLGWSIPFISGDSLALLFSLALFVICAANGESLFLKKFPQWLGKVSYSLYLIHIPILVLSIRIFHQTFPMWLIWIITISISLLLSDIMYKYIEHPFQTLGRSIAAKFTVKPKPTPQIPASI